MSPDSSPSKKRSRKLSNSLGSFKIWTVANRRVHCYGRLSTLALWITNLISIQCHHLALAILEKPPTVPGAPVALLWWLIWRYVLYVADNSMIGGLLVALVIQEWWWWGRTDGTLSNWEQGLFFFFWKQGLKTNKQKTKQKKHISLSRHLPYWNSILLLGQDLQS